VPPVLVYADLLATGDGRCMETAQMVYDRTLLDFSQRRELTLHASIAAAIEAAAAPLGVEILIVGAFARDLQAGSAAEKP
jgi:Transcriptional regulator, AbiEi antitoxin, Type IV TA system